MPEDDFPPDPVSALAASAASMHELFVAYLGAGFMRNEALYLIGLILTAGMRQQPPGEQLPSA